MPYLCLTALPGASVCAIRTTGGPAQSETARFLCISWCEVRVVPAPMEFESPRLHRKVTVSVAFRVSGSQGVP